MSNPVFQSIENKHLIIEGGDDSTLRHGEKDLFLSISAWTKTFFSVKNSKYDGFIKYYSQNAKEFQKELNSILDISNFIIMSIDERPHFFWRNLLCEDFSHTIERISNLKRYWWGGYSFHKFGIFVPELTASIGQGMDHYGDVFACFYNLVQIANGSHTNGPER